MGLSLAEISDEGFVFGTVDRHGLLVPAATLLFEVALFGEDGDVYLEVPGAALGRGRYLLPAATLPFPRAVDFSGRIDMRVRPRTPDGYEGDSELVTVFFHEEGGNRRFYDEAAMGEHHNAGIVSSHAQSMKTEFDSAIASGELEEARALAALPGDTPLVRIFGYGGSRRGVAVVDSTEEGRHE